METAQGKDEQVELYVNLCKLRHKQLTKKKCVALVEQVGKMGFYGH
ncbi:hypothetical protein [Alkalihalobacillus sp. BA299]|nr:hypothetical protein [Alkalihalobacillus sp. BA299]